MRINNDTRLKRMFDRTLTHIANSCDGVSDYILTLKGIGFTTQEIILELTEEMGYSLKEAQDLL